MPSDSSSHIPHTNTPQVAPPQQDATLTSDYCVQTAMTTDATTPVNAQASVKGPQLKPLPVGMDKLARDLGQEGKDLFLNLFAPSSQSDNLKQNKSPEGERASNMAKRSNDDHLKE